MQAAEHRIGHGPQRTGRLAGREPIHGRNGFAGELFGQSAGTGNRVASPDQLKSLLQIAILAELSLDQAGQGGPLLQGEQSGRSEVAGSEIAGRRLAELLVTAGEIKDVVDHLEGETELAPETVQLIELGGAAVAQYAGGPGTVGDQGAADQCRLDPSGG